MSTVNKIITKPPNRAGFQIRKPVRTTAEQEKALRDQLHIEIENRTKACSNSTYECTIPRVDGYDYCIRHILQDSRAPYKQCAYIYPANGKKCLQAAPKHDGKKDSGFTNFCFEHSRLAQLTKTRNTIGKYKQVETNEALLNDLSHHIKIDKHSSTNVKSLTDTDEEIDVVSPNADPFIDFDSLTKNGPNRKRILDYASDSTSDEDEPTLSTFWKGHECDNSDNESVDSQNEDLLKHAGIYTTEEATMITKQKMTRLQELYTEQLSRLHHLLREKRRKYLQDIKKERETLCSIHDQPKETAQERRLYEKLKALNHYHKRNGIEAVLYKKYKEKCIKATETNSHKGGGNLFKCSFSEGGVKCTEKSLPCCKYCKKHILEDKKQILFRACGVEKSGVICQEPVPNIFEDATCVLHINLPAQKSYTQKKFESETEEEEDDTINKKEDKETKKEETPEKCGQESNEQHLQEQRENLKEDDDHNGLRGSDLPQKELLPKQANDDDKDDHNDAETNDVEMMLPPVDEDGKNITIVHDHQSENNAESGESPSGVNKSGEVQ